MNTDTRVDAVIEPALTSDTMRNVRIGANVTGYVDDTTQATSLNLHTLDRASVVAETQQVTDTFGVLRVTVADKADHFANVNHTDVAIYVHTVETAEALVEAAEALLHNMRNGTQF